MNLSGANLEAIAEQLTGDDRERLREYLIQFARIQDKEQLLLFTPTGAQFEWIKMIGNHNSSMPRTKFFSGANKVLKSGATVACLGAAIWGPPNAWFEFPIFQNWPYPKTVWIDSEDSALKEIILPEMHKWFPKGKYKIDRSGKTFDYHWICDGKDGQWNIFIKTYDTAATKLESALLGLMIFSEPPPEDHFDAVPARMPGDGMTWMEFTPLVEATWVQDKLMGDAETTDSKMFAPHWWEKKVGSRIEALRADAESACKQHGERGIWEHEIIQRNISEYAEDERDARAHGEFVSLKGRVIKSWKDQVHTCEPHTVSPNTQYWMVMDPHERRYPFVKWYGVFPTEEYGHRFEQIYEYPRYEPNRGFEVFTECPLTIAELAAYLRKFEEEMGIAGHVVERIMDKQFGSKEYAESRRTVRDTWGLHGFNFRFPQAFYIDVGHDAIKEALRCKDALFLDDIEDEAVKEMIRSTARAHPLFRIRNTCQNSIRAMKNYKYAANRKGVQAALRGLTIEVEEKFKDPIDCDRYFLTEKPSYKFGFNPQQKGWRNRSSARADAAGNCGSYF